MQRLMRVYLNTKVGDWIGFTSDAWIRIFEELFEKLVFQHHSDLPNQNTRGKFLGTDMFNISYEWFWNRWNFISPHCGFCLHFK